MRGRQSGASMGATERQNVFMINLKAPKKYKVASDLRRWQTERNHFKNSSLLKKTYTPLKRRKGSGEPCVCIQVGLFSGIPK